MFVLCLGYTLGVVISQLVPLWVGLLLSVALGISFGWCRSEVVWGGFLGCVLGVGTVVQDLRGVPDHGLIDVSGTVTQVIGQRGGMLETSDHKRLYLSRGDHLVGCDIESMGHVEDIKGSDNPGEFDRRRWLRGLGLYAQWYPDSMDVKHCSKSMAQSLNQRMARHLSRMNLSQRGAIEALILGHSRPRAEFWSSLGLVHVLAISGLHLALLMRCILRILKPMVGYVHAYLISLMVSLCYVYVTGCQMTTVRAWLLCFFYVLGKIDQRCAVPRMTLFLGISAVMLTWDPRMVRQLGFWLSFGATFLIMYMGQYVTKNSSLNRQVTFFFGLLPVYLLFRIPIQPVSIAANLLTLPFFEFWVMPLVSVGALSLFLNDRISYLCLKTASDCLDYLSDAMESLQRIHVLNHMMVTSDMLPVCLAVVCRLWFQTPGMVLLGFLMLFSGKANDVTQGHFHMHVLSVGHGLSVVIQTAHHHLLYDIGSQTYRDVGRSVVVPFLQYQGIQYLDAVVISHADTDHYNGLPTLLEYRDVGTLWVGEPLGFRVHQTPCVSGTYWIWDGVRFEFLHPDHKIWIGNNASCVLRVSGQFGSVLLTGDIEKKAEQQILSSGQNCSSDILVAAHHGSKTSSSEAFLKAVDPHTIIISEKANRVPDRWNHHLMAVITYKQVDL